MHSLFSKCPFSFPPWLSPGAIRTQRVSGRAGGALGAQQTWRISSDGSIKVWPTEQAREGSMVPRIQGAAASLSRNEGVCVQLHVRDRDLQTTTVCKL